MDNNIDNFKEETIDIKKYIFKFLSYWYLFVITVFIAFCIAYLINRYSIPIYSVNSTILVRDKTNTLTSGIESIIEEFGLFKKTRKANVENEIGILQSYYFANKAVKELDFGISYFSIGRINKPERYKNAPFVVNLDTSVGQLVNHPVYITILSKEKYRLEIKNKFNINKVLKFGEQFINKTFNFNITLKDGFDVNDPAIPENYYFLINDFNKLANQYKNKLTITTLTKKGSILNLSLQGYVPQKLVDYLNKITEVYIRAGLEEKNQIAINTVNFIDEQLEEIVDSLQVAEINLQNFRLSSKSIIDISQEGIAIFQKLEKVQAEKTLLNIKTKYYDYLLGYIESKNNFKDVIAPSVMGIDDPLLNSLISQLSQLFAEKGVILYSAKENNPSLNVINLKIQNVREALLENVRNIINATNISLNDVNKRIQKVEKEIQKLPVTERQLINIQRKFNLSDNLYTFLLEKRAEAGIAKASNIADNRIIDLARVDNVALVSPKRSLNYIIALILGLIVPLLFIVLKDFFNNSIVEKKDVEDNTNIPILGSVGHNKKDSDVIVFNNPKSSISESFRSLRTNLQYLLTEDNQRIVSINSIVNEEGKTFCAINLASVIAMLNKKTLLVGMDLRKPKIHKEFNLNNDIGISTYLINKSTIDEIIQPSHINNLYITTSGPIPPNPAELIETEKMKLFFQKVKQDYDYVIVDTPPIAIVTDALLLTKYTDANIFVVRQNYTSKNTLRLLDELYKKENIKNLCILINDVKVPAYYRYGYDYGYGYGYTYRDGYGYYDEDKVSLSFVGKIKQLFGFKR